MDLRSFLSQNRILSGAAVLAFTQFGASLAGLMRDRMLARTFPGLDVVDVYIAAFRPSDLLFQVAVMSAFSVALVPLLARLHVQGDQKGMGGLLGSTIILFSLIFGGLALLLALFLPWLAPFLVGFQDDALALYVSFARIALLTNFFFVAGNAIGKYLITIQRYWIYGMTPILYTVGTILGTLFLTPLYGSFGPILGTLGGAVLFVLLRALAVFPFGRGCRLRVVGLFDHSEFWEMGWLMIPRVIALGALQLQLLLFDTLASSLGAGAITINAYARNFQAVLVGVVGIALADSLFSPLSQAMALGEGGRFQRYIWKGVALLLLLTVPGSLLLILLAPVAAWLVHLSHVLKIFSMALTLYALSIPFESINHLLLRAFYARKDSKTPALWSVINGVISVSVAWAFAPLLGVYALAIGFTVGQLVQAGGMMIQLNIER